jgi:hypothetical protein
MSEVATSNHVILRNQFGQFIKAIEAGNGAALTEALEDGVELSRSFAPKGRKRDKRTPSIQDSMFIRRVSRIEGYWGSSARHALVQERGGPPHPITGRVSFFWEKKARWWKPGPNEISHPGNPPHPYLRPAYDIIMARLPEYIRKHAP